MEATINDQRFDWLNERLTRYERRLGTVEQERDEVREQYEKREAAVDVEMAEMRKEMQLMREAFDGLRTAIIGGVATVVVAGIVSTVVGLGLHP